MELLKKITHNQYYRNMFSGPVSITINILLAIISYPVYLKRIGHERFGVWVALTTIINVAQLLNVGIGPILTQRIAYNMNTSDFKEIRADITNAFAVTLVISSIPAATMLIFNNSFAKAFNIQGDSAIIATALMPYFCLLTVYVMNMQLFSAILSGLGRIDKANYRDTICKVATLATSISLLAFGFDIYSLLFGCLVGYATLHIASVSVIRSEIKQGMLIFSSLSLTRMKGIFFASSNILASSIFSITMSPFSKLIISRYAGPSALTTYEIAFTASMQFRSVFESSFRALIHEVAKMIKPSEDGGHIFSQQYFKSIKLVAMLLPIYILLFFISGPLMKLWLGNQHAEIINTTFNIFLFGTYSSLVGVPAYYTLLGIGKTRTILYSHAIMSASNVIFVSALMLFNSQISVTDIALCTSLAFLTSTTLLMYSVHKALISGATK